MLQQIGVLWWFILNVIFFIFIIFSLFLYVIELNSVICLPHKSVFSRKGQVNGSLAAYVHLMVAVHLVDAKIMELLRKQGSSSKWIRSRKG